MSDPDALCSRAGFKKYVPTPNLKSLMGKTLLAPGQLGAEIPDMLNINGNGRRIAE